MGEKMSDWDSNAIVFLRDGPTFIELVYTYVPTIGSAGHTRIYEAVNRKYTTIKSLKTLVEKRFDFSKSYPIEDSMIVQRKKLTFSDVNKPKTVHSFVRLAKNDSSLEKDIYVYFVTAD